MLELTCAVVLISASLVTATPHGYGVKGGASSRVDASAGALGGLSENGYPIPLPLGAGYSGSFSKSSSSSASSSSASSSSSSFSYSGTGVGKVIGYGNNGASAPGAGGCDSGSCKHDNTHGLSETYSTGYTGAGLQSFGNANAVTTAGAVGGPIFTPGCQGENCNDDSTKCTSGQCKPNVSSESNNKCSSAQCRSEHDVNDIYVNTDATKLSQHTDLDYNKKDSNTGTGCSTGNCGLSGTSLPQSHSLTDSYGTSLTHNNQNSAASEIDVFSDYNKPALNLEAPKLESACTSGNCDFKSTSIGNLQTSYHIPVHGSIENNDKKTECNGANCDTYSSGNSLPINYLNPQKPDLNQAQVTPLLTTPSLSHSQSGTSTHNLPETSSNCGSLGCGSYPGGITRPSYEVASAGNNIFEHTGVFSGSPSIETTAAGCKTPGCAGYTPVTNVIPENATPSVSFGITPSSSGIDLSAAGGLINDSPSGASGMTKSPIGSSKEKLPAYTGGFGGPAGVLKPNEFSVTPGKPDYSHTGSTYNKPSLNTGVPTCSAPNCGSQSNAVAVAGAHGQTESYDVKPTAEVNSPKEKVPYTAGFGGPAGVLKPVHSQGTVPPGPSYLDSGIPPKNMPSVNENKEGCKTLTCGTNPPPDANSATSVSMSPDTQKLPSYTGAFGVPTGIPDSASSIYPSSPTINTQSTSISNSCKTPNCAYPTVAATANAQSGSLSGIKPVTDLPVYTGGFGGPSGVYKPVENTASASESSPEIGSASTECKTSNCVSYPTRDYNPNVANVHIPDYTHSGTPSYVTSSATVGSNVPSATFDKPSGGDLLPGKHPSYIGGFGGSAGVLKPNKDSSTTTPIGSPSFEHTVIPSLNAPSTLESTSTDCKTGKCDTYPTLGIDVAVGANSQAGSYDISKLSSGLEKEKLPAYTGGFGGPSGILKPNEYTASAHPIAGVLSSDIHMPTGSKEIAKPASCTSGLCAHHTSSPNTEHHDASSGTQTATGGLCTSGVCLTSPLSGHTGAANGAHAIATASADANAVVYTGGFGGPPGYLKAYDSNKIGAVGISHKQTNGAQSHNLASGLSLHDVSGSGSLTASSAQAGGTDRLASVAQAGTFAHAGAAAAATSGVVNGYNLYGGYKDQAGYDVKGGSGCSGSCGGSYSSGYNLGYSGGLIPSKLGYDDSLSGSLVSSGAAAKSLTGTSAFGHGGAFASSSATAHASAGVKGGYGRR